MDIKEKYNLLPVCPYCGTEDRARWKRNYGGGEKGEAETDCEYCGKTYVVVRCETIVYLTKKCG